MDKPRSGPLCHGKREREREFAVVMDAFGFSVRWGFWRCGFEEWRRNGRRVERVDEARDILLSRDIVSTVFLFLLSFFKGWMVDRSLKWLD